MEYVLAVESKRRLCVTATSLTTSFSYMDYQIEFLKLENEERKFYSIEILKRYMIRHENSSNINVAPTLVLPKSTTTNKMVSMT
mgnify:CR=1 FL=1